MPDDKLRPAAVDALGYYLLSGGQRSHFNLTECRCSCGCGFTQVAQGLVDALELLRAVAGGPVLVDSCCRCLPYNLEVYRRDNALRAERGLPAVAPTLRSQHLPWPLDGQGPIKARGPQPLAASRAADVRVAHLSPAQVLRLSMQAPLAALISGRGLYRSFTHLDVRPGPAARWGL